MTDPLCNQGRNRHHGPPVVTVTPNPGSDEARALGCKCPVLDNEHGRGPGPFWVNAECPLHGKDCP